uniref:7TM_GPCR_Srx domain-containing protein n=1 Tax=Ascaris lumbricoides TaxID=6252 RepID=A0A0M3I1C3_ASCLU
MSLMADLVWIIVSYGFAAGGVPIAAFNFIVLIGILRKKCLRNSFAMIAFMIFNGTATGVCLIAVGSFRVILFHSLDGNYMEITIPSKHCITDVSHCFYSLIRSCSEY